jgi:calcineurin-like phosphoesterase family protein
MKFDSKKNKIWFTGDTHYWQKNIVYGESVWPTKETSTRRFDTVQEMSRHLVKQINTYVAEDDILFHLGDWSFGGIENIWNFRKQLRVKKIHLIPGNHDHHIIRNDVLPNVYRPEPYSIYFTDGKPIGGEYPDYVEASYLFESVNKYLDIEIDGIEVSLLHYAMETWNYRHGKTIHLHGHCHGNLREKYNRLDVGIDNYFKLFKEYKPFYWGQILEILKRINKENPFSERH